MKYKQNVANCEYTGFICILIGTFPRTLTISVKHFFSPSYTKQSIYVAQKSYSCYTCSVKEYLYTKALVLCTSSAVPRVVEWSIEESQTPIHWRFVWGFQTAYHRLCKFVVVAIQQPSMPSYMKQPNLSNAAHLYAQ